MESSEIIYISISALITVFVILSGLAILMQIIIRVFPDKKLEEDVAPYSAIASVYSKLYPGTKITKIEEVKWFIQNNPRKSR